MAVFVRNFSDWRSAEGPYDPERTCAYGSRPNRPERLLRAHTGTAEVGRKRTGGFRRPNRPERTYGQGKRQASPDRWEVRSSAAAADAPPFHVAHVIFTEEGLLAGEEGRRAEGPAGGEAQVSHTSSCRASKAWMHSIGPPVSKPFPLRTAQMTFAPSILVRLGTDVRERNSDLALEAPPHAAPRWRPA